MRFPGGSRRRTGVDGRFSDALPVDRENLTVDEVVAYLAAHPMVTANWFGPTGRAERSTWIDRDGSGWKVRDTDERAAVMDFMTLRTDSEAEALDAFLRRAEHHRHLDVNPMGSGRKP